MGGAEREHRARNKVFAPARHALLARATWTRTSALLTYLEVVQAKPLFCSKVGAVTEEQLATLKALLLQRRQEILVDASRTVGGLNADQENTPDPSDRASIEANHISVLRVRDRERKLLLKIDEALARIAAGDYGVCESCGGEISYERLRVRPVTTLCVECKAEQEELERRPGHS